MAAVIASVVAMLVADIRLSHLKASQQTCYAKVKVAGAMFWRRMCTIAAVVAMVSSTQHRFYSHLVPSKSLSFLVFLPLLIYSPLSVHLSIPGYPILTS